MSAGYDRLSAARQDLDLVVSDLNSVSGQLEELATMCRRDHLPVTSWLDIPPGFPKSLQDATGRLVSTLRALVEAGPDQAPDLAFSAVAQLSALDEDIAAAANSGGHADVAGTADGSLDAGAWATVRRTLSRAGKRLWSLISHLVKVREWSLSGQFAAGVLGLAPASIAVTFG